MLIKKKSKIKKILLIGKNGFFAKNFIKHLKNHKLYLMGRKDPLNKFNLKKMDIIINCASDINNEKLMYQNNTEFVYHLIEKYIKQKSRAKIIHFGSASEYGINNYPSSENDLVKPETVYGGTKAAGTIILQSFSKQFKIPSVILRSYTAYGPFEYSSKLLPNIFKHLSYNKKLILYDGYQDYFYIDDLANILIKVIKNWKFKNFGEIINISSGKQYSNREILKICEQISKIKAKPIFKKGFKKSFHNRIWKGNPKKRLGLGYKFSTNINSGIKKYYQDFLNKKDLKDHILNTKAKRFNTYK